MVRVRPYFLRHFSLLALLINSILPTHAQTFGNEWISYNQPYWYVKVASDGWYSFTYTELQASGFPVDQINPGNIQVFGRGEEIPLLFDGVDPNAFQPGDRMLFRALGNDGWLDDRVYDSPLNQPNPNYSLFNDTASYFITYNSFPENLRTGYFFENNYSDYLPLDWFYVKEAYSGTSTYLIGKQDQYGISLPWYEEAEGWFDFPFGLGSSVTKDINTPGAYAGPDAPEAQVLAVSASASNASGLWNHHLQVGYGSVFNLVADTVFQGYQLNRISFSIPADELGATTKVTHKIIDDLDVATDYQSIGLIEIKYARDFSHPVTTDLLFDISNVNNTENGYIRFNSVQINNPRLFIIATGLVTEVGTTFSNGVLEAIVPFNGQPAVSLWLTSSDNISDLTGLQPVTSTGFFNDYASTPLDSAFVIVSHPMLENSALAYASYRISQGMESVVVNIEELYLQYAYGIWKHPLAIRNFCDHLLNAWPEPPSHLFLIGKSIHEMSLSGSEGARNNQDYYARNLVPTWGWPSSDVALTSGLGSTLLESAIPTGRLAAENNTQVLEYRNKVIELESADPAMWQKNILHFGGGGNLGEQTLFAYYLNNYKTIAQDTCLGGKVYTFLKETTDPVQINLSDSIQQLIEEGVLLMTFFGHASSTGFDQNIDSPDNYNNQGKYPLLIGNSCYTGNIHLPESQSTSENFVLVPDRGVIGFLAKSDLGQPIYLNEFTSNFYKRMFQKSYGHSIGQCMVLAVKDFQGTNPEPARINTALTFALHGDPAVRMYPRSNPDYQLYNQNISFSPEVVTSQVDSFDVRLAIANPGKAVNRPVGIELVRHFPDGSDTSYVQTIEHIHHRDTVVFTMPINPSTDTGLNTFDALVDYPSNFVPELIDISNNIVTGKSLLISSGDLLPVWPYPFAVYPQDQITLKANTGFVFDIPRTYVFQIDTTDTFDSPWLNEYTTESPGGLVSWDFPQTLQEERVYYWRCSADSTSETDYRWRESSFQYINGQEGWGQAHIFQIKDNDFTGMELNREERRLDFNTGSTQLKCEVYGQPATSFEALATRYQIDLEVQDYSGPGSQPCLMVAVIDSVSLTAWESNYNGSNPQHDYDNYMGSANARGRAERYFIFRQNDTQEMEGFANMVLNEVSDGNYLLIYSWQFADYNSWDQYAPETADVFQQLGASQIGVSQDSVPFIFFLKKGYPDSIMEVYGSDISDYLVLETTISGTMGQGKMTSPVIGPVLQWQDAQWNSSPGDFGDEMLLQVRALTQTGAESVIAANNDLSGSINLEIIAPADEFPALRLSQVVEDFSSLTPPPFRSWHILGESPTEFALDPASGLLLPPDTIDEGAVIPFAMAIRNISSTTSDSVLVRYWITDEDGFVHYINYAKQNPLDPDDILLDTIFIETSGYSGLNQLWIEVNPYSQLTGLTDQPEQHHFNNIAQLSFFARKDQINPLLDVTFDGRHILNEDIVSATPSIVIILEDESPFFLLNEPTDTTSFKVFLSGPGFEDRPLHFSTGELLFEPAGGNHNRCRVLYFPEFSADGMYGLLVQAQDKSGNTSGTNDYRINFEVITRPTITEVMNYPNPFSTSTQFIFTLTGTEIPDEMKIQIMTIGGRVVREIMGYELGPLHIGRNLTDFKWNGTDEFGDPLANGVYLYRVVARLNGQELEIRPSGADIFIEKGFGKMVIVR